MPSVFDLAWAFDDDAAAEVLEAPRCGDPAAPARYRDVEAGVRVLRCTFDLPWLPDDNLLAQMASVAVENFRAEAEREWIARANVRHRALVAQLDALAAAGRHLAHRIRGSGVGCGQLCT